MISPLKRLYFFEIFTAANLAAIALLSFETLPIAGSPILHILAFSTALALQTAAGVGVRALVALVRRDPAYFKAIRSREWLADTARLIVAGGAVVATYGWIKLVVPLEHPVLFDRELWELDRLLFFGLAPTILVLDLFDAGPVLRVVDWSYGKVFFASSLVAFAWFLSHPTRAIRVGFANGNALLWLSGAWLYMLVPSLGPAFRFPDIWLAHAESLRVTQSLQALLMRNYQNVLRAAAGEPVTAPIQLVFGIGAFPSLHVAFQMYVFLWMRRLWTSGEVLFAVIVVVIFLGSMITGWHYLIDAIAGVLLAWACWRFGARGLFGRGDAESGRRGAC